MPLLNRCLRLVAVMLRVQLRRFGRVVRCVVQVALSRMRVMRCGLVAPRLVVLGGLPVMPGRVFVVLRRLMVVLCRFSGNASSSCRFYCGA